MFNYLKFKAITIDCNIVNINRLTQWIHFKILEKHIKLDPSAIKVLAQCYYGNTFELIQIINIIYLIWPNQYVSTSQIKNIISNSVQYSIFEWIHAIFNNNKKKINQNIRQTTK
ncbi:hypothetical protein HIC20_01090 [Buchnera aphidicola (Hormaphis cornu)]|nr:hypothetical protein HIC20_01090 [Buchnera aphidicola (Hormaphis cornu)]